MSAAVSALAMAPVTAKTVCFVRHGEARRLLPPLLHPSLLPELTPAPTCLRARTTWRAPSTRASTSTRSTLTRT